MIRLCLIHTSPIFNVLTCSKQQVMRSFKCLKALYIGQNVGVPYVSPDTKLSKQLNTACLVIVILKQVSSSCILSNSI